MKIELVALLACAISWVTAAPQSLPELQTLSLRNSPLTSLTTFEKRKGGGGGKGGSGGTSSGSGGGRSGSGYSGYSFSSSSNAGGRTRDGSGTPKAYGNSYTGGATVPYKAGNPSPSRSVRPYAVGAGALVIFPGLFLFSVWAYPFPIGYHWYANGRNMTSDVTCLCEEYTVCGCDPSDNSTFLSTVLTNGSTGGPPVNTTMVRTVDWGNGTIASYINGSLENGTTADGGTDPSNEDQVSLAVKLTMDYVGYWVMAATVLATVTIL